VDASLWALAVSAFTSATVLPGNSEIVLLAVLKAGTAPVPAIAIGTVANTLGGMTTYAIGRLLPSRIPESQAIARVRRFGAAALLLAWVPFVGDALCAAAGWLKLPWGRCAAAMALGKLARYALVAHAATLF